jgi:hypothetical protein
MNYNPPTRTHMRIVGTKMSNETEESTFLVRVILTPDDDHTGRNM